MCFDLGVLKTFERLSTIHLKSSHRDLRTVGAQGAVLRIRNFHFSGARMLGGGRGGGGCLVKEGPTLPHILYTYGGLYAGPAFAL